MNVSSLLAIGDFPGVDDSIFLDFAMRAVDNAIKYGDKFRNNLW